MIIDRFCIFSTWEPRPETPETLGRRALETLDALSLISPHFQNWQISDERINLVRLSENGADDEALRKAADEIEIPLEKARDRMAEFVEYGVRRNDFDEPEPGGGYWISATAGKIIPPPQRYVSFSAHGAGRPSPAGLRFAELTTDGTLAPDPEIVAYPVFKSALKSIVAAWDPGYACAYPDDLFEFWHEPYAHSIDLAWMTYLSPNLAKSVTPPEHVLVEKIGNGGILMIAATETFDAENPEHMKAACAIVDSLTDLNARMAAEVARFFRQPTR